MKKNASSLPAFVWANFRLQWQDFAVMPLAVAGLWLLMMLVLGAISFFSGDNEIFGVGIPGVFALVVAVMMAGISSYMRIWLEFKLGVQLSVTRRRMLAAELALSLATAAEGLVVAWLLDRVWMALAQAAAVRYGSAVTTYYEPILAYMPWWGWLLCWLLPMALGTAAGAVVLRFGAKGGWTVYMVFMLICTTSSIWIDRLEELFNKVGGLGDLIMAALPPAGFVLAVAAVLAAARLLLRVAITD